MKFKTLADKKLFLVDVGEVSEIYKVSEDWEPSQELVELFIKRRKAEINTSKDFRKSQAAKKGWRHNRYKMEKGVKRFHKSTKGKRFHRQLGKFLATRLPYDKSRAKDREKDQQTESFQFNYDTLKAIASLRTHAYIEFDYYMPVEEHCDYEDFVLELIPFCKIIESKIITNEELTHEEIEILFMLTEATALIKSFSDKSGKSETEIEGMWDEIKKALIDDGKKEDDEQFYGLLVSILKKKLGLD